MQNYMLAMPIVEMKTNKRILLFIAVLYSQLFLGIFFFYVSNPFDNECVMGGCWNGYGTYIYNSGITYKGEWRYGKRHGKGTLTYPHAYTYEGEFKNNKMDGHGTRVNSAGVKYTGEWKNGKKNGMGTIQYASSNIYEGYWKNDMKHGKGTFTYNNYYSAKWIGEWKNDMIYNGEGTNIVPTALSGLIYEGKWMDGKITGTVKSTSPKGNKFRTEMKNGEKHGQGTLIYTDGRRLKIEWKNNRIAAPGIMVFPDGRKNKIEIKKVKSLLVENVLI